MRVVQFMYVLDLMLATQTRAREPVEREEVGKTH